MLQVPRQFSCRTTHTALVVASVLAVAVPSVAQIAPDPLASPTNKSANPLSRRPDPFIGSFEMEGLRVEIEKDGANYRGRLAFEGQTYAVTARRARADDTLLQGTFRVEDQDFEFEARVDGDVMRLTSEDSEHVLRRANERPSRTSRSAASVGAEPSEDEESDSDEAASESETDSDRVTDDGTSDEIDAGGTRSSSEHGNGTRPSVAGAAARGKSIEMTTFRHPIGFRFQHPAAWQIGATDTGLVIVPDDAAKDSEGNPIELFLLSGDDASGIAKPDSPEVIQYFDALVSGMYKGLSRSGTAESVECLLGPGAVIEYGGRIADGLDVRVTVYFTIHQRHGIFLAHIAAKAQHEKRAALARRIFSSFGMEKAEIDEQLVRSWTRSESSSSSYDPVSGGIGANTTHVWEFRADGTCSFSSDSRLYGTVHGAGGSVSIDDEGSGSEPELGTWGARDGKLAILWESGGAIVYDYLVFDHQGKPALKLQDPPRQGSQRAKPRYFLSR
jgi:hypothetical protein